MAFIAGQRGNLQLIRNDGTSASYSPGFLPNTNAFEGEVLIKYNAPSDEDIVALHCDILKEKFVTASGKSVVRCPMMFSNTACTSNVT